MSYKKISFIAFLLIAGCDRASAKPYDTAGFEKIVAEENQVFLVKCFAIGKDGHYANPGFCNKQHIFMDQESRDARIAKPRKGYVTLPVKGEQYSYAH